ncbi:MAG: hypothetical protein Q8909_00610 [Bacteroidota bacterium]|nr:hypothetical protein [Bacteroidota bacterium]
MDKYLSDESRINMFNRILAFTDEIEQTEEIMKLFFDKLIPYIEHNINQPYSLFKHFQTTFPSDDLRYILYDEIILFYLEGHEPYILFENKVKLNQFLKFIDEEMLKLSDKLGIMFDANELLQCVLQDIIQNMDECQTLEEKKEFLLSEKIKYSSRLNSDVVYEIDKLLDIINEQIAAGLTYVDLSRIEELSKIDNTQWDVTKLIKLCEELNCAYSHKNFITIPILIRAIIDHIPPVFKAKNFNEVVAQYGTKSFKESMSHLDRSLRKVSDSILHSQIRDKETLPNHTQIDFRADLDVLLAEIYRLLKD